jgi:hypothetical protein
VRGLQHSLQPPQQLLQTAVAPAQSGRAFEGKLGRRLAHLLLDVGQQRRTTVTGPQEEVERRIEPAAIQVRVEVAEAR